MLNYLSNKKESLNKQTMVLYRVILIDLIL